MGPIESKMAPQFGDARKREIQIEGSMSISAEEKREQRAWEVEVPAGGLSSGFTKAVTSTWYGDRQ